MRVAVVQMNSGDDQQQNLQEAMELVDEAVAQGAGFVVLPEYMTYLGPYEGFCAASETIPGPTSMLLAAKAREHRVFLHGGSLIEKSSREDRFYNTSVVFDPQGKLIALYRKTHLFDVDVPDGVTDTESSTILPGDELVIFYAAGFRVGLSICYDVRFPEVYRRLAGAGAELLVIPAAFAEVTGQAHWEILIRARAIDNFAYVLAPGQHGSASGSRFYGHSMIVDPWGRVLSLASHGDTVLTADVEREEVLRRRAQIPVLRARRPDLYAAAIVKARARD